MAIIMGGRYQLVRHPNRPIGIPRSANSTTREIMVEWEDKALIPPKQYYPEDAFSNGTLEFIGWSVGASMYDPSSVKWEEDGGNCIHDWAQYNGFNEFYEYCRRCDVKKEIK